MTPQSNHYCHDVPFFNFLIFLTELFFIRNFRKLQSHKTYDLLNLAINLKTSNMRRAIFETLLDWLGKPLKQQNQCRDRDTNCKDFEILCLLNIQGNQPLTNKEQPIDFSLPIS